jgi:hypothetical protein
MGDTTLDGLSIQAEEEGIEPSWSVRPGVFKTPEPPVAHFFHKLGRHTTNAVHPPSMF